MTPELKLAQFLSSEEEKQKLASEMSERSVEELAGLLKVAQPKEELDPEAERRVLATSKKMRDMEKKAVSAKTSLMVAGTGAVAAGAARAGLMGTRAQNSMKGLQQFVSPSKEKKASPDELLSFADELGRELAQKEKKAALAFGAGKALKGAKDVIKSLKGAPEALKKAVKEAPAAGKSMAGKAGEFLKKDWQATKEQFSAGTKGAARPKLEKTEVPGIHHNVPPPPPATATAPAPAKKSGLGGKAALVGGGALAGAAAVAAGGHRHEEQKMAAAVIPGGNIRHTLTEAAKRIGKGAHSAVSSAAGSLSNIKDPIARGAAVGGVVGGVGGAAQGFLDPKENPVTGEKQRLRTAFRKGLAGAAQGASTGAIYGGIQKSSSVKKLASAMEKHALGMQGIGSMAKNFVASAKPMAQKAMTAAMPHVQQGVKALGNASMGQAAGAGAVAGGALGAAKGLVAPGKDAQGNTKSRIGGALKGAVGGAAGGAALGAGAKAGLTHLQGAQRALPAGGPPMKLIGSGTSGR